MNVDFPGLRRDKTAAGTVRWRVRVEGDCNRKIKIPVGPTEPGFLDYYLAARAGEKFVPREHVSEPVHGGTLDALSADFTRWMENLVDEKKLSRLTLDGRKRALKFACDCTDSYGDRLGSLHVDLPKAAFLLVRDKYKGKTAAADNCMKALRAAYFWGNERDRCEPSPVFQISKTHRPGGGAKLWTREDADKFLAHHPSGSIARLWYALADTSAGRIGDMNRLGPENLEVIDGTHYLVYLPAKKGSKLVQAPVQQLLAEELLHHGLERKTFLVTQTGKAFASPGSLDNKVRKWIKQAGLVDEAGEVVRSQHGIRKGVATAMGNSGASVFEIMSLLGHADPKTATEYTRNVERRTLATSGRNRVNGEG